MNVIVAIDKNWAIGNNGELLAHIPADMKQFREKTTGKVVVLGRRTLETFPGRKPLKDRTNIILTRDPDYRAENAIIVHSIKELLQTTERYDDNDIYVIGGESVYEQLMPYCHTAYVTVIDHEYEADAYFPVLDTEASWKLAKTSEKQEHKGLTYEFREYERIR